MSAAAFPAAGAPAGWNWAFGRKIADWTIGFVAFLGAFVIAEPAPYELLLVPVIIVSIAFGLKLNRHMMPMVVLLFAYLAGGSLALTQTSDLSKAVIYVAVTGFLVASSIFFAAVIAEAPERRLRIITNAYIASAAIASLIGIAAYFNAIPGADLFKLYGRVKSTFQDPNVFGPFLVLPIVLLYHDILTHRGKHFIVKGITLLVILSGEFLSFSRAAWGMTILCLMFVSLLVFFNEPRRKVRWRMIGTFAGAVVVLVLLLAVALSIPAVHSLFLDRAELIESYDAGRLGRFARQAAGFALMQERPLGLGALDFGRMFGEDEHNTWLKGFTTYGWLGGFAYITLVLWTIVATFPLLFKPRPWRPVLLCTFVVFIGQVAIHNVIDNDHWRHLFMIYGILWGIVAAEKLTQREWRAARARPTTVPDTRPA